MKKIEIEAYEFSELSENAKNKVRQWYIETNYDWDSCTLDYWKDKLESLGVQEPKILYSGFWSQGDGACFTCSGMEVEKFLERPLTRKERWILDNCMVNNIKIVHSDRYFHEKSTDTELHYNFPDYVSNQWEELDKTFDNTTTDIEHKRLSLCREIYNDLKSEYEYATSDQAILEACDSNKWFFTKKGEIL
jgi:hypothetical protein